MQNIVTTISRQYGSGGRQIGALLAKRLNIPFYDSQIIELAAKQSHIAGKFFIQPEQCSHYLCRELSSSLTPAVPLDDQVYLAQHAVIREVAQKGPCVIVGRGAGGILKDTVPLLNVLIYANLEKRKQRAIAEYGDDSHKIEEHISAIDKRRASYFRFYTGVDGSRMENYHLCIDSGFTGIDNAVTLIETAYLLEIHKAQRKA
ncbi:MAG: cytidylate kinase-like family protein [Angelakisella sp.]